MSLYCQLARTMQILSANTDPHHHPTVPAPVPLLQVARTKQILSANTEASISVEELWQDKDFGATITREKFEELAGEG